VTRSEEFVYNLSRGTFLALWTYATPVGRSSGKELCDVLVVCDPAVVIFSVKHIELASPSIAIARDRWIRRAVDESVHQIRGAERALAAMDKVNSRDGNGGVNLGPCERRITHRVAVAVGSDRHIPLVSKDYGHGFVHVFDDHDIFLVLRELDTITDLLEYFSAREGLNTSEPLDLKGSEGDLLAEYICRGRCLDHLKKGHHDLSGRWDWLRSRPEYIGKIEADRISYVWDNLISRFHYEFRADNMEFGGDIESVDQVTRVMAKESRFSRRGLGRVFEKFFDDPTLTARFVESPSSGVGYVFLKRPHSDDRKHRKQELLARCFITRDNLKEPHPVVGIATERHSEGEGSSVDGLLLDVPIWTEEMHAQAVRFKDELGFFASPRFSKVHEQEFPDPGDAT